MPCEDAEITELLTRIGDKTRAMRKSLGLSRRVLSEKSGISPRYLAQLESGQGNISISLLFKLSKALNLSLGQFLGEPDQFTNPKGKRIALIGLRGAGKSTLGPLLAEKLSIKFLELTQEIETSGAMPIPEIFSLYGEEGFRRLERRALERIREGNSSVILAVAGGIVADTQTYAYLLSRFHTIWLRAKPEEHMARVRAQGDERPMSGSRDAMAALKRLLASRELFYTKADADFWTSNNTPEQSLVSLVTLIETNQYLAD